MQRRTWILGSAILIVLALAPFTPALGDTIWRKNGSKLMGKIVAEEEDRIQVHLKKGTVSVSVWIPRDEIALIERGKTPAEEYQERMDKLEAYDLDGHRRLIDWAKRKRLLVEAKSLEARLPAVEILHRIHTNPRRWCRTCQAVGEVLCSTCEGKGKTMTACERCEGLGKIRCQVCGHREGDGTLRCRRCSGAGEYERFNPAKGRKEKTSCPDCRGKGTHRCPECGGKQMQPCPVCEGKKGVEEVCESCQEIPRSTCPTCSGTGLQPTPVTPEQLAKEAEEAAAQAKKALEQGTSEGEGGTGTTTQPSTRPRTQPKATTQPGRGKKPEATPKAGSKRGE